MRQGLNKRKRWVIKLGTSSLTDEQGNFSFESLEKIVSETALLKAQNYEVILVSSGAIALGMEALGIAKRPKTLPELQACAAIGQGRLMGAYERAFKQHGLHSAQILLTRDGLQDRERYLNVKNTLSALLKLGVVPIVNENDTVATEEIKFGDNDTLSVLIANVADADLLVFLSDIEGFYLKDKTLIRHIHNPKELEEYTAHIHSKRSEKTAGGMRAKLQAAKVAMQSGIPIVLANGRDKEVISKILKGEEIGSLFYPSEHHTSARKKWMAHSAKAKGVLTIDAGACRALTQGKKSLLPSGVKTVSGEFEVGDLVRIQDEEGNIFACGLVHYDSREIEKIKGHKTSEIVSILGYHRTDELVHRNNLAFLE